MLIVAVWAIFGISLVTVSRWTLSERPTCTPRVAVCARLVPSWAFPDGFLMYWFALDVLAMPRSAGRFVALERRLAEIYDVDLREVPDSRCAEG
jgi:hypothetical protein